MHQNWSTLKDALHLPLPVPSPNNPLPCLPSVWAILIFISISFCRSSNVYYFSLLIAAQRQFSNGQGSSCLKVSDNNSQRNRGSAEEEGGRGVANGGLRDGQLSVNAKRVLATRLASMDFTPTGFSGSWNYHVKTYFTMWAQSHKKAPSGKWHHADKYGRCD